MEESLNKFLEVWKPYHKELFHFVDYDLDKVLARVSSLELKEEPKETRTRREFLFEQLNQVQYILLEVGEENLAVEPMYHWVEFKLKYPKISEVGFLTPFSYLCHWLSLPHLNRLIKEDGFRDALFIAEIYLDLLNHKVLLKSP